MAVQKLGRIMNALVALDDIFAEMLWAATKSVFSVGAILVVILGLGISRQWTMLLALPVLGCVGVTRVDRARLQRAGQGLRLLHLLLRPSCSATDDLLEGVYFPIEQLPLWLQRGVAIYRPASAVIGARPLVPGPRTPGVLNSAQPLAVVGFFHATGAARARRRFFG